ncbi:hypothetical protein [Hoeflea sp.]|uniref:hypothetical protein n=1 Tax=Hoeflea sp. TaxID=1940281 RepID=UPI003B0181B8
MSNAASIAAAKAAFRSFLESARYPRGTDTGFFADDARINVVHPFNEMDPMGYAETFLAGLETSFRHLTRAEYMAFGGAFENRTWVTATGYYTGHFEKPWLGLAPTGALAHLRFGEFHCVEDGKAVESYIFLDIPELMIAAGQWPIAESPGRDRGFTGYLPGPMTQDGLQWQDNDPERSAASYEMVTSMLRSLATEDEAWRPYWHEDMLWYGPAAFGSFVGVDNFAGFQVPFEQAFSEWIGGAAPGSRTRHFTRFADGNYICSGGWPSLNAVQAKPFLGQPSQGKRLYMRVCDWWRREGDLLAENWVFVDIPHVLLQMGFDVFAAREQAA